MGYLSIGGLRPRSPWCGLAGAAALAAILLVPLSSARAALIGFDIDPVLSFMTLSMSFDMSELGIPTETTLPQAPGSDTTTLDGTLLVDLTPTSIDIGAGGASSTILFGTTGDYAPFDPVTSDPTIPPTGVTPDANFGLKTTGPLGLALVVYDLEGYLTGIGPKQLAGGSFSLASGFDSMIAKAGRTAFSSSALADTKSEINEVQAVFATAGFAFGSWDGVQLTIPIESALFFVIDTGSVQAGSHIYVTQTSSGVIVATPAPEPSSLALLGFAGVGSWLTSRRRWRSRPRMVRPDDGDLFS